MIVRVDTGKAIQDASKGCQKWIDRKRKRRCNGDIFLIYLEKREREKERDRERDMKKRWM